MEQLVEAGHDAVGDVERMAAGVPVETAVVRRSDTDTAIRKYARHRDSTSW
jgi:hypothetical protein